MPTNIRNDRPLYEPQINTMKKIPHIGLIY